MESAALEAASGTVVKGASSKPVEKLIEMLELICCYGSKVDSLKDETHGLEKKLADVKCLIYDAERNGKEILQEPSNWVKDSETKLEEAEDVFQKSSGLQPCCWPFNTSDCNCKRRYEVGDKAVELKKDIEKLMSTGKSINEMTVSVRPRRPQRLQANFAHPYRSLPSMEGYIETLKGWLIGDEKHEIVGVYGSKGSGKTLLVQRLAVVLDSDDEGEVNGVVYIDAKMELKGMQQRIAERVGLVLQNEAVQERGLWLIQRLVAIGNVVFIVDNVELNSINLDLFGIPWSNPDKNGCRFVVVSTSVNICKRMNTQMELVVEPLSKDESLHLFKQLASRKHGEGTSNTFQKGIDHISSKSTWLAGDVIHYYNKLYFGFQQPETDLMDPKPPQGIELVTEKLEDSTPLGVEPVTEKLEVQNQVLSALSRGESRIGIYGMSGMGKTRLAMHLNNEILSGRGGFQYVIYVAVLRGSSLYRFEWDFTASEPSLFEPENKTFSVDELRSLLHNKGKPLLLILDDMWENIQMEEVEVVVEGAGCKLLITTRKRDVCVKMKCNTIVEIKPLPEKEAWDLFVSQLGDYELLSSEAKGHAKSISKECSGFPLGIFTMARSMRGESDEHVWRDMQRQLRNASSEHDDMEDKVFGILKLSYERLNNAKLQECFLFCALYPEDYRIRRDKLINHFIALELINESTGEENRDKGHSWLNALEGASLLESVTDDYGRKCVKMHDLIRDMALKIIGCKGMVKARKGLKEMPQKDEWTKDLVQVSLMDNEIRKIGDDICPGCPKLLVLILRGNGLEKISQSFFIHMVGLRILDLSYSKISELPDSICSLRNLHALLLRDCTALKNIPSLAELMKLRELDLFGCFDVTEWPKGFQKLINLEHLDIRLTKIPDKDGLVYGLRKLECLLSNDEIVIMPTKLMSLKKLWILECRMDDIGAFNQFVGSAYFKQLKRYSLGIGSGSGSSLSSMKEDRLLWLFDCQVSLEVPHNVQVLHLIRCRFGVSCLQDALPSLCGTTELAELHLRGCSWTEYIMSDAKCLTGLQILKINGQHGFIGLTESPYICLGALTELEIVDCDSLNSMWLQNVELPNLKSLTLDDCGNIEDLSSTKEAKWFPKLLKLELYHLSELRRMSRKGVFFPKLEQLIIHDCPKLEKLGFVNHNMPYLEVISISYCAVLEEIFETGDEAGADVIQLPKLRKLSLVYLPELRSICNKAIACNSINKVEVFGSETVMKLNNFPISVPRLLINSNPPHPKLLFCSKTGIKWNSLHWNDPDTLAMFNQLECFYFESNYSRGMPKYYPPEVFPWWRPSITDPDNESIYADKSDGEFIDADTQTNFNQLK